MKKILLILLSILLAVSMVGCTIEETSHQKTIRQNEEQVASLIEKDTLPKITKSLERENIKRRIEFINQPDRIGYLYLLSDSGQLIREVQLRGKVSSLNSYLTPMEELSSAVIETKGGKIRETFVAQAADLDGTYGENSSGIFWFTIDGVYQEWSGMYFYSSERMTFTTQPLLVESSSKK